LLRLPRFCFITFCSLRSLLLRYLFAFWITFYVTLFLPATADYNLAYRLRSFTVTPRYGCCVATFTVRYRCYTALRNIYHVCRSPVCSLCAVATHVCVALRYVPLFAFYRYGLLRLPITRLIHLLPDFTLPRCRFTCRAHIWFIFRLFACRYTRIAPLFNPLRCLLLPLPVTLHALLYCCYRFYLRVRSTHRCVVVTPYYLIPYRCRCCIPFYVDSFTAFALPGGFSRLPVRFSTLPYPSVVRLRYRLRCARLRTYVPVTVHLFTALLFFVAFTTRLITRSLFHYYLIYVRAVTPR